VSGPAADDAKPYKGLFSFGAEDASLFFGRDREAEQLVAKVLSSAFTVLHAQSGSGKTSLLNAVVLPSLEAAGWVAVRCLPQIDPVLAIQFTALMHVLPPPDAERLALQRAWQALDAPQTLGEILRRYDALDASDPRRRALIAPVEVDPPHEHAAGPVSVYPRICSVLRSTLHLEGLADHLAILRAVRGTGAARPLELGPETPLSELHAAITDLGNGYWEALGQFAAGVRDLRGFFGGLVEFCSRVRPAFGVVVVLDQAEELFTLFVAQSGATTPARDWRLRWEFFDQLNRLIAATTPGAQPPLPIRFVLSLRSDYYTHLEPVRVFAWDLDACSYHLGMLSVADAKAAIIGPARVFGYDYEDACIQGIVDDLVREERFLEPPQLQIVCDTLWRERDRFVTAEAPRTLPARALRQLGGARGILDAYLRGHVNSFGELALEALELLEALVTRSGTRNIVSRSELEISAFRDERARHRILESLVGNRLLREESRLGGRFIEIAHEFLVDPILDATKALSRDAEYARFRWAVGALGQLAETGQDPRSVGSLRISEFLALHDNRHRTVFDEWAGEVMLRSALNQIHFLDQRHPREILEDWVRRLANVPTRPLQAAAVIDAILSGRGALGGDEIMALAAAPDEPRLPEEQALHVLRSLLSSAVDAERDVLAQWTRRVS
jgi:hypothetical protein